MLVKVHRGVVFAVATRTEDGGQRLGSLEEFGGSDSVAIGLVNWDVDEGPFEGRDNGAAGRDSRSRHYEIE